MQVRPVGFLNRRRIGSPLTHAWGQWLRVFRVAQIACDPWVGAQHLIAFPVLVERGAGLLAWAGRQERTRSRPRTRPARDETASSIETKASNVAFSSRSQHTTRAARAMPRCSSPLGGSHSSTDAKRQRASTSRSRRNTPTTRRTSSADSGSSGNTTVPISVASSAMCLLRRAVDGWGGLGSGDVAARVRHQLAAVVRPPAARLYQVRRF
jgi:hypothetical protein